MIDSSQPAELKRLWSQDAPRVVGHQCLNVRHRERNCRICVDACPAQAISIPEDGGRQAPRVLLDPDACVSCGLCLHACPTGVFVQAQTPEARLLESVLRAPDAAVELACPRKEPLEWSRVPDASVVQTPHCLAALSVPMLLELAATGKTVWLNDAICHACPIGQASDAIRQAVDTANRWLQASGHGAALQSYRSAAHRLADEPAGRPAERSSSSTMSRRDFFRSFTRLRERGAAGSAAESATGDTHEPAAAGQAEELHTEYVEGQGPRLPHHIPAQRQRLAAVLGLLARDPSAPVSSQGLPIADVQATDSCTACSLCTQFCPTEALSFVSDEAYYVLNFSAALCLGEECSLCVIGCPVDAVRFGSQVAMEELLSTQPRPIKAGRLTPCARCGMLTGASLETDEAPLCYVCQAQAARPSLLARSQAPSDGKTES